MIQNYEPTDEERRQSFQNQHMGFLSVIAIEQCDNVIYNGLDKDNRGAKPEYFSGHSSSNHHRLGFSFFNGYFVSI
jgi:hypothetical protein